MSRQEITARVRRVAEQALAEKGYAAPIDVLVGLGWLAPVRIDEWRQGRLPVLERKPGALAGSTPLKQWREQGRWPVEYDRFWQGLQERHGKHQAALHLIQPEVRIGHDESDGLSGHDGKIPADEELAVVLDCHGVDSGAVARAVGSGIE